MNTATETIPAAFSPETAFTISLSATNGETAQTKEALFSYRSGLLSEAELTRRGIPESALHD
jgi:hypothetical protein